MPESSKCIPAWITCAFLVVSSLAGCATAPSTRDTAASSPSDPFESINRGVWRFNEGLDKAVLRPTARVYRKVVPQFVRTSVGNVFSNLKDIRVALNNALQGKFATAYSDFGRVAINSTLGVLGLFDIASEAGIERHDEDFGQTLGWWGLSDGPFLMLPLFGPSSGRDLVGLVVDYASDPVTYVDPTSSRNQLSASRLVNRRAELLDASTVVHNAALDEYQFIRDAYLQRRRSLVYDGAPPRDKDELIDGPPKPESAAPNPPASNSSPESASPNTDSERPKP